jgi:bacteriocin-like protein
MQDKDTAPRPKLAKKLTLHKETVRVLTEKELAGIEGGAGHTSACTGNTCGCGTCGNNFTTCPK